MTIYNVRQSVVELIEADSEEDALNRLAVALMSAGFECYDTDENNAFESEDLGIEYHVDRRGFVIPGARPGPVWR